MTNTSQAADSTKGEGEARLLHNLFTSLVQDMIPIVKTLQQPDDVSLLQDVDDDDPPLSESENEEDPPAKRPRTEPRLGKQPSSKMTGESATDATGKRRLTCHRMTEDEVRGQRSWKKSPVVLMSIIYAVIKIELLTWL